MWVYLLQTHDSLQEEHSPQSKAVVHAGVSPEEDVVTVKESLQNYILKLKTTYLA